MLGSPPRTGCQASRLTRTSWDYFSNKVTGLCAVVQRAQTLVVGSNGNHITPACQSPNTLNTAERGDTLRSVGSVLGVPSCVLAALNPQINSLDTALTPGDKICVPGGSNVSC